MLKKLKKQVYEANMALPKHKLVIFTWGNVSGIDRKRGLFVIKPSGVPYDELSPDDMVVMDLRGNKIEGDLKPSSDAPTHLALYNNFYEIGGVAHTHSAYAVSCAQAGIPIIPMGTTHADHFYKKIPLTRDLTLDEINGEYEYNTGMSIVEALRDISAPETEMPGVLVKNHGPFAWGKTAVDAVYNITVLEEVAKMFALTKLLNPDAPALSPGLMDKHFLRKHGINATYGQENMR